MITGYLPGSDLTFMNSIYTYPRKIEYNGKSKWTDDTITLIYRDNKTGKKKHETIYKPDYTYYKSKDEYTLDYPQLFIEKDKVEEITVPFLQLEKNIAERTNQLDFFKDNIRNGARYNNKQLHTDPSIFNSDMNIEDYYRFKFSKEYTNNTFKLHKAYFDIEVDGKYQCGDFPELGECPVNCVSYLDEKQDKVYTFILRNNENPLIQEFEDSINDNLFKELREFIIDAVGGWKQATRFGLMNISQEFLFFDDEISLIKRMFDMFHEIDPDFILAWNMAFDIPYIIERIKELGYNPEDIMCNKNFKVKVADYYIDTRNQNEFAERTDYATISGNIVWLDQMLQFAQRRKSKIGSFTSFKLDNIGESVAKVKKLDYSDITTSVIKLPYLNFKIFVFYNIMDTIVQKCIESKAQDIEYVFMKAIMNNTSYKKAHRQTVYLINRFASEFDKDGFIIGNNCNRWNEKPEKFLGALVGKPENTNSYAKMKINGRPTMLVENMMDEDYKSLYPSITLENNIAPNTQIARIIMDDKVYKNENAYNQDKYSRSGEFIENLVSDCIIEFCSRYFYLANVTELLCEDLLEYDSIYHFGIEDLLRKYNYGFRFGINKIQPIHFNITDKISPIKFFPESLDYSPFIQKLKEGGM